MAVTNELAWNVYEIKGSPTRVSLHILRIVLVEVDLVSVEGQSREAKQRRRGGRILEQKIMRGR